MDLREIRLEGNYFRRKFHQCCLCGCVLRIRNLWVLLRVWNFALFRECDPYRLWTRTCGGNRLVLHRQEGGLNWLDGCSWGGDELSELRERQNYDKRQRTKAFCDGMSNTSTSA